MRMVREQSHWMSRLSIKPRDLFLMGAAWLCLGVIIYRTDMGDYLDSHIAAPVNFGIRDLLNKNPKIDPRIKIFAVDDKTFARLGTPMPELEVWGKVLSSLHAKKPRLIILDAMLSAKPADSQAKIDQDFKTIIKGGAPVVPGAFVAPSPIPYKHPLSLTAAWYQVKSYVNTSNEYALPEWKSRYSWRAYGPAKELSEVFKRVGHVQLFAHHKTEPFLRLSDDIVLPHVSMYAAEHVTFEEGSLSINQRRVPLDREAAIDINFLPYERWSIKSFLSLMDSETAPGLLAQINEGDVILLLPFFYTGHTDFRPSPFGLLPGGLFVAAMVNSVLTNQWLGPILATEALMVIGICLAFLTLRFSSAGAFGVALAGTLFAWFLIAQAAFSFGSMILPWLQPSLIVFSCALHAFILKTRANERKSLVLRAALEGAVEPKQLETILKHPTNLNLEPRERTLSILFVDIAGFSNAAENMLPRLAFERLKEILSDVGETIHQHGGVIDKTLGDGLLCYFGYRFDSDMTSSDHYEQAIRCAIQIQRQSFARNQEFQRRGEPLYPLRIGVNTASCYLGDLGSHHRVDFTVVGHGVNFAKRLEGACSLFSVLVGRTTWELSKGLELIDVAVERRFIFIKHHKEPVEVFELNPFVQYSDDRNDLIDAFRTSANLQRLSERIVVSDQHKIVVNSSFGSSQVANFSRQGISLIFRTPLGKGDMVKFRLDSHDQLLGRALRALGIDEIEAEVLWQYQSPSGFIHGMVLKNLPVDIQDEFVNLMCHYAFERPENEHDLDQAS